LSGTCTGVECCASRRTVQLLVEVIRRHSIPIGRTRDHSGSEGLSQKCEHALTDRYRTYFGSFVVYLSLPIP
jgi:hypothetical protein